MADTIKKKPKKTKEVSLTNGQPNPRLKTLLNLISDSKQWSAEEKKEAKEAIQAAEKELTSKNREIEIQTSLEKVRSIALSMKHPSDMPEVCRTISQQLESLGVTDIRNVQTAIINESRGVYMNYEYYARHDKILITEVDYSHPMSTGFINQMLKGPGEFFSRTLKGKELKDWYEYQKTTPQFADDYLKNAESLTYYWYSLGPVALGISTYLPLRNEEMDLFKRFRNVFELAYRRFLDIETATAQAREAQIEAALERVRASALAMLNSKDVNDAVVVMFEALEKLEPGMLRCGIGIIREEARTADVWATSATEQGTIMKVTGDESVDVHPLLQSAFDAWKNQHDFYAELKGEDLIRYYKALEKTNFRLQEAQSIIEKAEAQLSSRPLQQFYYVAPFEAGNLFAFRETPFPDEAKKIIRRFASVFNLTYKRFLDLQKAEEQTREAQIEASLERVRSAAMAMHDSSDLKKAAGSLFTELNKLGINPIRSGFVLLTRNFRRAKLYPATSFDQENTLSFNGEFEFVGHPIYERQYDSWQKGEDYFPVLEGEVLKSYYRILSEKLSVPYENFPTNVNQFGCFLPFSEGFLFTWSTEQYAEAVIAILNRFKVILNLTITRFIDLQKAEAQARESKIETALEKVRAQAMAMHTTEELKSVGEIIFTELKSLGLDDLRNTEIIINRDEKESVLSYYCDYGISGTMEVGYKKNPILHQWANDLKKAADAFVPVVISEKEMPAWRKFREEIGYPPDPKLDAASSVYYYSYSTGLGALSISSFAPISDEQMKMLARFRNVFALAYRRYVDVALAEAQAREARIELALERVRARTMAMQKSEELSETAQVLFQQFNDLGANPIQITIGIYNEEENVIEFRSTDPFGTGAKVDHAVKGSLEEPTLLKKIYADWKEGKKSTVIALEGKELSEWVKYRINISGVPDDRDYSDKRRVVYVGFFSKGMLSVSSIDDPSRESVQLLERFAGVFDLTYTRFLDLKQAEAQAREAIIETALEKVRSRSLAMHSSDEIKDVVVTIMKKMNELNIEMNGGVSLVTFIEGSQDLLHWYVNPGHVDEPQTMLLPYFDNLVFNDFVEARKAAQEILPVVYSFEEKNNYFEYAFEHSDFKIAPEELKKWIFEQPYFGYSVAIQKHSAIFFNDYTGKLFTKETNDILIRFSKVFEQAYVRFLDLQKAEAQAKEAQIEAALERVRSRTMGMQKSEELKEVIQVVFQQFAHLNINIEHTGFVMDYKARDDYNLWIADPLGVPSQVTIPYFDSVYYNRFNEAKEKGEDFFATNLTFEEKNKFYQKLFEYVPGLPEESKKFYFSCPGLAASTVLLENIGLYIENFSGTPYSDEENATLMRFGKVFQQTYTRFLDLQKAEAQARESQIQLALERVRARTMAMQRSDELKDAAALLFQQVKSLGVPAYSCGYNIWEKDDKEFTSWMSTQDGSIINGVPNIPLTEDANFIRYVESKQKGEPFFVLELRGERMQEHYQYLKTIPAFKVYFDYAVSVGFDLPETQIHHLANFSHGNLLFITLEPCPEYHDVFKRLGAVFEQTYTRFLDLKKAEAQAREAQIETALERVRGVAMSMMKSDELLNVCESVFKQLKYLGSADLRNAQIYINYDDKGKFLNYNYSDDAGGEIIEVFYDSHPNVYDFYKKLKESSESFADYEISGAQLDEWKYYLNNTLGQKRNEKLEHATELHYYFYSVGTGALGITTFKPIRDEELQILKRFRNVFNLSYQRYTDIALAEAQAREAKIEAGLERVRSRTLAMHSSDELAETAAVVFRQLIALGIEPNRLYIAIVKDENGNAEFWITDEDGSKVSSGFTANLNENPTFQKMFLGWTGKKKSLTLDMQGRELEEYFEYLTQIKVPFKGGLSQKRRIQSIAYFSRGFIGIASPDSQPDETTQLLERFASVFNLTYARFNDLQMAEAQTHKAQIETALEKVRARALAMQEPEELKEVAWVLRNEMGLLGVEELETCSIYIRADNSENAECWFAIKKPDDDKKMVADYFALNLTDTWVGKEMLKFYNSDATQISIVMKGEQRSEWIEYCYKNSSVFSGFYGEQIPDRTYHLYKFSNGAIGAAAPGNISEESWELLGRAASVFSLAYSRFKDLTKSRIDLQNLKDEKKRSDSLLLNILPEEIANELKQFGKSYARKHEQVTILFADIKNFSSIAENLSAQELVTQLDECFRAFDHIVDKHGLEKIKTVGDAYVCACGLPKPVADNAVKAVRAALDMQSFIKGFAITKTIQDLPAFEFRVGINTGSVITGVVGLKKFTYDIWGDAVNMAARMEQHGEAGKINISDSTYQLIKDKFTCTPRGKIEAKNKGEVEMYFVEKII